MSETALEQRTNVTHHRPVKAWLLAAVLFVFGVRLLAAKDR
jgi:hypothetical protein